MIMVYMFCGTVMLNLSQNSPNGKERPVLKTDRRVLKTEQALESALLKLMHGKSIDQITTTELCRTAGINRNTF